MAYTLMEELIEHPDKEISEIIEKHFPNKKPGMSIVEKPASVETKVSIEAAMAAVEKSEKIQSERQKQKEEELRKKKEKEAAQKAKEEKEAKEQGSTRLQFFKILILIGNINIFLQYSVLYWFVSLGKGKTNSRNPQSCSRPFKFIFKSTDTAATKKFYPNRKYSRTW